MLNASSQIFFALSFATVMPCNDCTVLLHPNPSPNPNPNPAGKHVVFGRVVEGMAVVKRMEAAGSKSGRPLRKVVIADCGQQATRLSTLMRLKAEKEELERLRQDPLQVALDPDEASRQRLKALKEQLQSSKGGGAAAAAAAADAAAVLEAGADQSAAERSKPGETSRGGVDKAGAAPADRQQAADEDVVEGADPYANMSARERKLHELRQKLSSCRKANQNAVIAEKKRESNPQAFDDNSQSAQLKW